MENSNKESRTTTNMKILQLVQKNFATLGVSPNLSLQPYPFNTKIIIGFVTLSLSLSCNLVFAISEAKTFTEQTQSIYMVSLTVLIMFALTIIILKVNKLFCLIDDCENLVNTSEYERFATFIFLRN